VIIDNIIVIHIVETIIYGSSEILSDIMSKREMFYDVSAELDRVLGPIGSPERQKQTEIAWEEYNREINAKNQLK